MSDRDDYPWRERWPSVIDVRIPRDPAGKGYTYRQMALVRLGFPPDFWLDPQLARKWKNVIAPMTPTPDAVRRWRDAVIDMARIATALQSPAAGDRYYAGLENDLGLIGQHDPTLLAPSAATPPLDANPGPSMATADLTAVERALMIYLRDPNQSLRQVAQLAGCSPSLLSRDPRFQRLREAHGRTLPKGRKSKEGDLEAEAE